MKTKTRGAARRPSKTSRARTAVRRPVRTTHHQRASLKRSVRRKQAVHRRLLLHPVTVFGLLCVGVLITAWTVKTVALSYTVNARVPAAPLTEGAFITYPVDGQVITSVPITVHGTCPQGSYVKLFLNNAFDGSAWCSNDGTFDIQTGLMEGLNVLRAQDYNITDDPGPVTPSVHVTYSPPAPQPAQPPITKRPTRPGGITITGPAAAGHTLPLFLSSEFHFQAFAPKTTFNWSVTVLGGQPPFYLVVDWGDGSKSSRLLDANQTLQLEHAYKKSGYYPVRIHATDAKGQQAFLQLAALIKVPGTGGFALPTQPNGSGFFSRHGQWLWLAWPAYAILVLMAFSFWLGEREEYQKLLRQRRLTSGRAA